MIIDVLEKEINNFCEANRNPEQALKCSHFFVEGYSNAYGIQLKTIRLEHKQMVNQHRSELGMSSCLELGGRLIKAGSFEKTNFAILFAGVFPEEYTPAIFEHLGSWLDDSISNWAHADMLAGDIFSTFLLKKVVPFTAFSEWRTALSKWKRRVVPVSLIKNLKYTDDIREALEFITPMMLMPEKVVHQGLGWFLRKAWEQDPQPVEDFLLLWKDTAPRLTIQYATEKMTADQKSLFRK